MRIVIADPIHSAGIERLEAAGHTVVDATDASPSALEDVLVGARALVVRSATPVTADLLSSASELEVVARAGIGVDTIDIEAATTAGVLVVNAPTGGVEAVADHTMALCHAIVRELPWTDRATRRGEWPKDVFTGGELAETTLGIVGLGRIGRTVARRGADRGMTLVGTDPAVDAGDLTDLDIELESLHGCASEADVLTVHTPLVPETEGLIDEGVFDRLDGGALINCARGGVVDEAALIAALDDGRVDAAAIDVFADEPIGAEHPLAGRERTLLTPHVAGTSERAQRQIAREVATQLEAVAAGEPVEHPVNEPCG